jgi:uncharacterized membrane protein (UPF0127 family)
MEMGLRMMRKSDQTVILNQGVMANTFMTRLVGLMGRKSLSDGEGMFFPANNSIHMWMMRMPIDALFLKKHPEGWQIMALYPKLKPWKVLPVGCFKADDTLELPVGTIERLKLKEGEVLCIAS